MKKIILLFFLFVSSNSIFAQHDSLLKKFKFRIDNFRAIGLDINGGSQFNKTDLISGTAKNSSASGGLGGNWYSIKSTDKILLTTSAGLYGAFNRSISSNPSSKMTSKNYSSSPVFYILNKWFTKNMFTELGTDISGSFNSIKNTDSNFPSASTNNLAQYSFAVNLGIGKGRLENVTDMQNALWLNKALIAAQKLSDNLSTADLIGLGQSITKGNNTRVLDSRKRTQFLLETVDNYLQQKGLIGKTDISYFGNLNDILFFAFNSPRYAGTEKFIRLRPSSTVWNENQTNAINQFKHRFNSKSLVLATGINKYIPSGLIHQNNYGAALTLTYTATDLTDRFFTNGFITSEVMGKTDLRQAGISLFYEHAIYPNTRTIINFNLQSETGYQHVDSDKDFYAAATFSAGFNYFISYRTRLSFNTAALYQKNYYSIDRYLNLRPDAIQLFANAGLAINL